MQWLACRSFNLKVGGSSLASAVLLFPFRRNFSLHCLSSPRCINRYQRHNAGGGNLAMD